jgi:hypothetical protein
MPPALEQLERVETGTGLADEAVDRTGGMDPAQIRGQPADRSREKSVSREDTTHLADSDGT